MTIFLPDLYLYHFLDTRYLFFLQKIQKNPDDTFFCRQFTIFKVY